ncbi:hypothetical protein GCM10027515_24560 [Schumannella luteola]|uniref:DUF4352 domain-containing protein n=1 Tax=Schumannella luteola TaxID=472059 RepID=A0A852Y9V5_9MICO|nr:hypothetical protein [Schumannella luteola]NYG99746.1 hypothetical protein [Schumannella luteola]TPX06525.1 hypothetical protein FJ656_00820 [Schumannella luteola]
MTQDRARLTRRIAIAAVAAVALVGVILVIALGGLADDEGRVVDSYRIGERIEASGAATVIESVTLTDRRPAGDLEAAEGRRWLIVSVTQTNLGTVPLFVANLRIGINYGSALDQTDDTSTVDRVDGGLSASPLQPGVATRLDYVFDVPADETDARNAVVGVYRVDRVYGDPVFGDTSYSSPHPVGRIEVADIEVAS